MHMSPKLCCIVGNCLATTPMCITYVASYQCNVHDAPDLEILHTYYSLVLEFFKLNACMGNEKSNEDGIYTFYHS